MYILPLNDQSIVYASVTVYMALLKQAGLKCFMQRHSNRCREKKPSQNLSLDPLYYAAILIPQSHSPLKLLYVSTKRPFMDFLVFYSLNKIRSAAPK